MNNQFDVLTKNLAKPVTRRAALKIFCVGLAGMALSCVGLAAGKPDSPQPSACSQSGDFCGSGFPYPHRVSLAAVAMMPIAGAALWSMRGTANKR